MDGLLESIGEPHSQEHYEPLRAAYGRLDAAIAGASSEPRAAALAIQAAARHVYALIERHQAEFECPDGPLATFVELKPGLISAARRRQEEHLELLRGAQELDTAVEREVASESLDLDLVRTYAGLLRDTLRLHLMNANALGHEALFVDEGGEGG